MSSETKIKNICYLAKYLRKLRENLSEKDYLASCARKEHGTGTGIAGISNTGSSDCLKEEFRRFTDALGQKFTSINLLIFKTAKGSAITQQTRTKRNFTVEHTMEAMADLYDTLFEQEFIIKGVQKITPKNICEWLIKHHICVGIDPTEEKKKKTHGHGYDAYKNNNFKHPFEKYTNPVFYKGQDISNYTYDQIQDINKKNYPVPNYNWNKIENDVDNLLKQTESGEIITKIDKRTNKPTYNQHVLPPLELSIRYWNDELELILQHYHYKRQTLFDDTRKWSKKPTCKAMKLQMAQQGVTDFEINVL